MPKQFDANELNQLANANEIEIETRAPSGRTHRTTIWVAVDDNEQHSAPGDLADDPAARANVTHRSPPAQGCITAQPSLLHE